MTESTSGASASGVAASGVAASGVVVSSSQQVPDLAVAHLRAAGNWTRMIAVILAVGIVVMILGAVASFILSGVVRQSPRDPPIWLIGVGLLFSVIFYVPPVVFLLGFASRAKAYARDRRPEDLTRAMKSNKSFWKYVGILVLLSLFVNLVVTPIVGLIIMIINK